MKKNLFYLFSLLCSVSLFTACSNDDDEDNSWKKLPDGEIVANDIDLNLNGESTTGTIEFKAKSSQAAEVAIKNVIDGYSDVTVDAVLEKQTDGSFRLSGTKNINTKPVTRMALTPAPFLKVVIDGVITLDGKLTLDIQTSGPGLYIGTYKDGTLALSYGGEPVSGKTVVFDATDGSNISILLQDVIPGESETILTGVQLTSSGFSGSFEGSSATISYTGSRVDKILTLDLNVTMKDPQGWAKKYVLNKYAVGTIDFYGSPFPSVTAGALFVEWKGIEDSTAPLYSGLLRGIGGMLLPQVLQDITLAADGNVGATISSSEIQMDQAKIMGMMNGEVPSVEEVQAMIPTEGWQMSPKNLAYWYEKDGKLYLKLNIANILAQSPSMGGLSDMIDQILKGDAASIKSMLKLIGVNLDKVADETFNTILGWVNNGFPMTVRTEEGHTYIYLDKEALAPLLKARQTGEVDSWGEPETVMDLVLIWSALVEAKMIPEEMQAAGFLVAVIGGYYNMSTDFNLGFDLVAQ